MDNKILNEFRQDLVSGDWVLFATGRARKPSDFVSENNNKASTKSCPFDDPVKSGQEIIWRYPDNKSWEVMVIRNKFPAVKFGACGPSRYTGPFKILLSIPYKVVRLCTSRTKQRHAASPRSFVRDT